MSRWEIFASVGQEVTFMVSSIIWFYVDCSVDTEVVDDLDYNLYELEGCPGELPEIDEEGEFNDPTLPVGLQKIIQIQVL